MTGSLAPLGQRWHPRDIAHGGKVSAVTTQAAVLIFTGGVVYTVDAARSWTQAVAVR